MQAWITDATEDTTDNKLEMFSRKDRLVLPFVLIMIMDMLKNNKHNKIFKWIFFIITDSF